MCSSDLARVRVAFMLQAAMTTTRHKKSPQKIKNFLVGRVRVLKFLNWFRVGRLRFPIFDSLFCTTANIGWLLPGWLFVVDSWQCPKFSSSALIWIVGISSTLLCTALHCSSDRSVSGPPSCDVFLIWSPMPSELRLRKRP